ncbi:DTW domain-containing 2 [Chlorella sorokiniana]|uniref:tRNA-uridine aminocarboxypropyltransferase n=1 Tax=Chlorella sorokiniana TaxID=3076 RepID=A0A2P6TCP1_CHLSO|nr:DTW domain-containing 2 [Chlorella sorokiniana]|eukprot:PRW20396.1 DTW domain-containing 2 [Chlorella sorokiniana]
MPADWDLPALQQLWSDEDELPASVSEDLKRDCTRCSRPKSVCLCPWLPAAPLQTAGRIVILQHPHELKKRLATVPLLQKCLGDVTVLRSRYYQPSKPQHAALQQALEGAAAGRYPLLVLFPGGTARDVQEVAAELQLQAGSSSSSTATSCDPSGIGSSCDQRQRQDVQQQAQPGQQQAQPGQPAQPVQQPAQPVQQQQPGQQQRPASSAAAAAPASAAPGAAAAGRGAGREPRYVLLVIDGTWKQAKEMFAGLRPHALQPDGPGIRVQLPPLAAAQQAHQEGAQQAEQDTAPAADSCARQPGPAAADAADAAADNAQQHVPCSVVPGGPAAGQAAAGQAAAEQAAAEQASAAQASAAQQGAVGGEGEKPLLLRMEPMVGCLTTCEAVARALGALEPQGSAVRDAVLRPLAQLAQFQARWDPSLAMRLELGSGYSQSRCRMGLSKLSNLAAIT